jgi:hypothetical protein
MAEQTTCSKPSDIVAATGMSAEWLNSSCFCVSLDRATLMRALSAELASPQVRSLIEERIPTLFSERPVFISDHQFQRMAQVIQAVETVVAMPAYRTQILEHAPAAARYDPGGAKGVFFGYDFHVSGDHLGLIEINTNAGGAMLNAVLARAHQSCCLDADREEELARSAAGLDTKIVEMFRQEWNLSRRGRPLQTIAIVDAQPQQQYLYPEFLLFQGLFERHGLHAVIADPSELTWQDGRLQFNGLAIDLVYNRLTDFMLASPECRNLLAAYLAGSIVLTPHPQAYALYANKRNLALFSDAGSLQALAIPAPLQEILLENIPRTQVVTKENVDQLWQERRHLFFKPMEGYGSRATYRGDKLTKRVWDEILSGEYVAQAIAAPGERISGSKGDPQSLKFDIRCYVYDGRVQWMAARMYQGQTTNFRTRGGGFAPVYRLPDTGINQDNLALLDSAVNAMACCRNVCD